MRTIEPARTVPPRQWGKVRSPSRQRVLCAWCGQNVWARLDPVFAANRVCRGGYTDGDQTSFLEGLPHPDIADFEPRLLAGAHHDWVEQVIESTGGTIEVLPRCLLPEYEARSREGLWVEANAPLVPVRVQSLSSLPGVLDTSSDPWIINAEYSTVGLQL
jgi:hypothetical protein